MTKACVRECFVDQKEWTVWLERIDYFDGRSVHGSVPLNTTYSFENKFFEV